MFDSLTHGCAHYDSTTNTLSFNCILAEVPESVFELMTKICPENCKVTFNDKKFASPKTATKAFKERNIVKVDTKYTVIFDFENGCTSRAVVDNATLDVIVKAVSEHKCILTFKDIDDDVCIIDCSKVEFLGSEKFIDREHDDGNDRF